MQRHGLAPSGDAAFEAVDEVWREAFEPGEQGAQDHEDAFIEYLSGNIDDAGAEDEQDDGDPHLPLEGIQEAEGVLVQRRRGRNASPRDKDRAAKARERTTRRLGKLQHQRRITP